MGGYFQLSYFLVSLHSSCDPQGGRVSKLALFPGSMSLQLLGSAFSFDT